MNEILIVSALEDFATLVDDFEDEVVSIEEELRAAGMDEDEMAECFTEVWEEERE